MLPCSSQTHYDPKAALKVYLRLLVNNVNFKEEPCHVTSLSSEENGSFGVLLICFLVINTPRRVVKLPQERCAPAPELQAEALHVHGAPEG